MKKFLCFLLCSISVSCFAATTNSNEVSTLISHALPDATFVNCGHAVPTSDPQFCASFKSIAYCHCHDEHGMPPTACNSMPRILQMMTAMYGSLWAACSPSVQHDTSQQECVDDWNFYNSHC